MKQGINSQQSELLLLKKASSLFEKNKYSKIVDLYAKTEIEFFQNVKTFLIFALSLRQLKRNQHAIEVIHKGIDLHSAEPQLWIELGQNYFESGEINRALKAFNTADQIDQRNKTLKFQIGLCKYRLGNDVDAINSFIDTLNIDQKYYLAWLNLGNAFIRIRKIDAALEAYSMIPPEDVNFPMANFNKSLCHLLNGDFEAGWLAYEWRRKIEGSEYLKLNRSLPEWDGLQHSNRRIYISSEQGIGDEVFFSRWLCNISKFDSEFTIALDDRLHDIYRRSFPKLKFISKNEDISNSQFDQYLPIGSLPNKLRSNDIDKPAYLFADDDKIHNLKEKIDSKGKLTIGISWISKNSGNGIFRSIQLNQLTSVFDGIDAKIVSLQYGDIGSDFSSLAQSDGRFENADFIDKFRDIDSLTALISACDLIVSVDNSTIHFAGALGKQAFVLLNFSPDWRWGLSGDKTNWYHSLRLFRQTTPHSWEEPIKMLRQELVKLTNC